MPRIEQAEGFITIIGADDGIIGLLKVVRDELNN
jgi:hypothetical protein